VSDGGYPDAVTLGDYEFPVPEQRIGRMTNKGARFIESLTTSDLQGLMDSPDIGAGLVDLGRRRAYDALCLVVPQLSKRMAIWEFAGYASQEAMDAGDYDEAADRSPTWPQIVIAFEVAKRVNRFDFLDSIKTLVKGLYDRADPTMVGQWVNLAMAEAASRTLPSSPSMSGESASTSSTQNGLTTPSPVA
jgi:hypothetical protein